MVGAEPIEVSQGHTTDLRQYEHPTTIAIFEQVFNIFFETGFLCVALAVLELALLIRLALNLKRSSSYCLASAGLKGVCHHHQA